MFLGCGRRASHPPTAPESGSPQVSLTQTQTTQTTPLKGVSLSPRSFEPADFNAFLAESAKSGGIISWAGDWAQLESPTSAPFVVAGLARSSSRSRYVPIIELQIFSQQTGKIFRPLDITNQQKYIQSAVNFVTKYQPEYLGIGIEINVLSEKAPADFDAFVQFFANACDAVKIASPGTQIFTIFQLEKMKGLGGGLFGGRNDVNDSQWKLLERFAKADLFAFTTYPGLVFRTPSEIPQDYYMEIRSHTNKRIGFTEIGWQSESVSADWQSSQEEQAQFVRQFFAFGASLDPQFYIWSFLFDQQTFPPFDSMGLFKSDGTPKSSWYVWLDPTKN
jgi:hypothetical protein